MSTSTFANTSKRTTSRFVHTHVPSRLVHMYTYPLKVRAHTCPLGCCIRLLDGAQFHVPSSQVKSSPFDSATKRMSILLKNEQEDDTYVFYVKGAAEQVWARCWLCTQRASRQPCATHRTNGLNAHTVSSGAGTLY